MARRRRDPEPRPCPFCGMAPIVRPQDPSTQGSAWGEVRCIQHDCPAKPVVLDGETVADDRGSAKYRASAIARWNAGAKL